jgi:D-apionolactonase
MSAADPFLLYGTHEREAPPLRLVAGRLAADFADGNLRTITYDGVEVLRSISYLVRDRDWGTYRPRIEDLSVRQDDGRFALTYRAHCQGPEHTALSVDVSIEAGGGALVFKAKAVSTTGFDTNRCGFCILHPIIGVAGGPVAVEHVDGRREETVFPDLIEPWQPFKDMRAITHPVMEGVSATCRMEGDVFEMEDQRNWSDASYKTYVRPLALPWPYRIEPGKPFEQTIALTIEDGRPHGRPAVAAGAPVTIRPGSRRGMMPNIGLVIRPEDAASTLQAGHLRGEIGAQELLFHFDPLAGHGKAALQDFAAIARLHRGRTVLEIALPCDRQPDDECREIAEDMRSAGLQPDAIAISPAVDRQSTPPGSEWPECPPLEVVYAAAHGAFADIRPDTRPNIRIGGGMLSYFTELNRKRVPPQRLDFVTHCTNPIVHAADDLSVMQTLEALPFITRSVRAIYGDMPYRIGPSTIAMRQNPYGNRTMDNPHGSRIAMADRDPRHNGRFGEAFAMGYAIRTLEAGLECLTLSALTGPFGLVAGEGEPSAPGAMRPIGATVRTLASLAGSTWQEMVSSSPGAVLAFVAITDSRRTLHVVNLTPDEQSVHLDAQEDAAPRRILTLSPYETRCIGV